VGEATTHSETQMISLRMRKAVSAMLLIIVAFVVLAIFSSLYRSRSSSPSSFDEAEGVEVSDSGSESAKLAVTQGQESGARGEVRYRREVEARIRSLEEQYDQAMEARSQELKKMKGRVDQLANKLEYVGHELEK